jgi:hypothetical protein
MPLRSRTTAAGVKALVPRGSKYRIMRGTSEGSGDRCAMRARSWTDTAPPTQTTAERMWRKCRRWYTALPFLTFRG